MRRMHREKSLDYVRKRVAGLPSATTVCINAVWEQSMIEKQKRVHLNLMPEGVASRCHCSPKHHT